MKIAISPDERLRLCVFSVGNELCAIDIMRIKEIIRPVAITPMPKAPFGMLGVIDLRGQVLPLFDLRERLEVVDRKPMEHPLVRFLLIRLDGRYLGLVVDEVHSVVTVKRDELKTETHLFTQKDSKIVLGMCSAEGRLALLLNIRALLEKDASVDLNELGLVSRVEVSSTVRGAHD